MGYPAIDKLPFDGIRTNSVYSRMNLVTIINMARPYEDDLQDWRTSDDFAKLADTIVETRLQGKPVIWSMGAHVIKNGLSRYIIEMVKLGILTHVSGNGATSIHDFELAFLGETSEDVARAIEDGSFGMWEETGRFMNEAIQLGAARGLGYGASLYEYLNERPQLFPHYGDCVFAQCQRYGVPYTCHISIGTDIIHQHPIVNFRDLGAASGRDFAAMCQSVAEMEDGGVFLNFGSAISGPEVFLKAVSIARNAGLRMADVTAANFDIVPVSAGHEYSQEDPEFYYRPRRNFIDRLQQIGGTGYLFHGLHQVTIPHLFNTVRQKMRERGVAFEPYARKEKLPKASMKLYPVVDRKSGMHVTELRKPGSAEPAKAMESAAWNEAEFEDFCTRLREAAQDKREVLISLGGNVIGSGASLFLLDMIKRGAITHLAVVGACAFQDFELAAFGHTEESDQGALKSGTLGMWREPGAYLNEALRLGAERQLGYGESLLVYAQKYPERFPHLESSLLGICLQVGIPYTVHITIGTDAIQQHPDTDFGLHGEASGKDFQAYCHTVSQLEGGVFLNFGSTVTGPEVFLKALSIARNLGHTVEHITTANFDIIQLGDYYKKVGYEDWDYYYRPRKNIIHRPTSLGGKGFHFEGMHQKTIPALWRALNGHHGKEHHGKKGESSS